VIIIDKQEEVVIQNVISAKAQPGANNFLNYIYLFNNNSDIRIKSVSSVLDDFSSDINKFYDKNVSIILSQKVLQELSPHPVPDDGEIYSDATEIPRQNYIGQANGSLFDKFKQYNVDLDSSINLKPTNDPGQSPYSIHFLDMLGANSAYNFIIDKKGSYLFNFQTIKLDLRQIELEPIAFPIANAYYTNLSQLEDQNYIYQQEMPFKVHFVDSANGSSSDNEDKIEEYIQSFFNEYGLYNPVSEYSAIRVGVPLNFENYSYGISKSQELGINLKQPEYKKIYNYYDEEYETTITELVKNLNFADERILPSVYDFLYAESQKDLNLFLNIPNYSQENINFSSIDNYLNAYAQFYSKEVLAKQDVFNLETVDLEALKSLLANMINHADKRDKAALENIIKDVIKITPLSKVLPVDLISPENKNKIHFYFSKLSNKIITILKEQGYWHLFDSIKSAIYFSEKSMHIFDQTLGRESTFPFLVKLNIPSETMGPLAKLFSKNNFLDEINAYTATNSTYPKENKATIQNYWGAGVLNPAPGKDRKINLLNDYELFSYKIFLTPKEKSIAEPDVPELPTALGATAADPEQLISEFELKDYDVDVHMDNFDKDFNNHTLIYGENDENESGTKSPIQQLINKLKSSQALEELKSLVFAKTLGPGEINDGQFCYQETLMYEIAKYKVSANGSLDLVQNIFLPISETEPGIARDLSYFDTQIVPFQKYVYKIFVHKAVIGSRYKISNVKKYVFDQNIRLEYEIEPFIQMVRVPYYNVAPLSFDYIDYWNLKSNFTEVVDAPPLPPDINFVPFRNVKDRILILLNNTIGEQVTHFIPIFPEEKAMGDAIALSQDVKPGKEITFKSDDSQGTFQVIRLNEEPSDYKDFAEANFQDIIEIFSNSEQKNDSLVQDIMPNKDYYYIARFIDIHGNISNPTDIFKIRMHYETGILPYLTVNSLDMRELQKKAHQAHFLPFAKAKKYILIKPSNEQSLLFAGNPDVEADNPLGGAGVPPESLEPEIFDKFNYATYDVKLGSNKVKDSVFGKRFKIRVTSKQTGKKIDINIDVKQPNVIIND